MYNIYTYQKKKQLTETEKKIKKGKIIIEKKRKAKNLGLVESYEKRVKNFIYDVS